MPTQPGTVEIVRIINEYESEVVDMTIDLDTVHRIEARTWTPPETSVVCDQLTLATTADGAPIILIEDTRDAEGYYTAPETREPYTEMRLTTVWVFDTLEEARQDLAQAFSGYEVGTMGHVVYSA